MRNSYLSIILLTGAGLALSALGAEDGILWRIGSADRNNSELALAPGGYKQFQNDGVFIVGQSNPKLDWPYVQPGPVDDWAGRREHTFVIFFGLAHTAARGRCQLQLDLIDTQHSSPPALRIQINGQTFDRALAAGATDESIEGNPALGATQTVTIPFPASLLRRGENDIQITTVSGSWMLYGRVALTAPASTELTTVASRPLLSAKPSRNVLVRNGNKLFQPVTVTVHYFADAANGSLEFEGAPALPVQLHDGWQTFEILAPEVAKATSLNLTLRIDGKKAATREVPLQPVRHLTIYVLPHSHNDIGYTQLQTEVEKKQVNNLLEGIAAARRTANYPEGARFVWNLEVLWSVDLYLKRLSEQQRADFFDAVKKGQVALDGMFLNELTGLCSPEELTHLFRYSTELGQQCGVTIDAAMISDVPGATWGTVTAMAQAGIKYFSAAPNWFDRIGTVLDAGEDRPFYWTSRSGHDKVLLWIPYMGYALSHINRNISAALVDKYEDHLDKIQYPYGISYIRWSGHGDNAVPDPEICDAIRDWNAKYAYPKFIISSTSDAFRAFEKRYGKQLPVRHGDWTPYWEDGAGSSSLETALNRATSDRLSQAERLWAILNPTAYPAGAFDEAWRHVLLYSEHTWGAAGSITDPGSKMTQNQWAIKRSYATQADAESRALFDQAFGAVTADPPAVDVFNTTSWPRSEVVIAPGETVPDATQVLDEEGAATPSQRLSNGDLAFLTRAVPPLAGARYAFGNRVAAPLAMAPAVAEGTELDNGLLHVRLDDTTGGIVELRGKGINGNLADTSSGESINEYLYLPGHDLAGLQPNGPVKITMRESGPLIASLVAESGAPGCRRLTREIRIETGSDAVEIIDTVDKAPALLAPHPGDWEYARTGGKESVNFAFPLRVPDGVMRMDIPLSLMQPDVDQIPGACKNWFPVNRWVDVANDDYGVTWVTLDAPLVEAGAITANLLGSQHDVNAWRKVVGRTQKIYSWAMNNHWHTNYRASQDGPVVFRYFLRPHKKFQAGAAARLAADLTQPLVVRRANGHVPDATPRLQLSSDDVSIVAFKPSDDGKAWMIRLFGSGGRDVKVNLNWAKPEPRELWLSDTGEQPLRKIHGAVTVPAWDLVTLRAER